MTQVVNEFFLSEDIANFSIKNDERLPREIKLFDRSFSRLWEPFPWCLVNLPSALALHVIAVL